MSATICIDLKNIQSGLRSGNALDLILNRFEHSGELIKSYEPSMSIFEGTSNFSNFGPSAFASNDSVGEELGDRCFSIYMDSNIWKAPEMDEISVECVVDDA